jgi:cobalt/nickel transport system permease protein
MRQTVERSLNLAQQGFRDSPLRRLDPRWKLAALLLVLAAVALVRVLPAAAVALGVALVLATAARLPLRWYLVRVGVVALFLAPFVLTLPFLLPGPLGEIPSWHGCRVALLITVKALALVTLVLVLLASAPPGDTLKAAHSLRVPGLLLQLFVLTGRYVGVVAGELARLRVALRVRGYRNRMTRHCYRTVGHVAGTLLVRSHERGERVGQAMRCRGFDGRFRSLADFHTTPKDVVFFLVLAAAAAGLVAAGL